jgi:DNA polymerase III delta prime subunit
MPPVSPKLRELPFEAREFTWATFEDFFCAFLASQPTLLGAGGNSAKVIRARPYGRKGDKQNGIDIRAVMDNKEVWAFQCKHYPRSAWTPAKTQKAIKDCTYEADRKFLLVTRELSEDCFEVVEAHDDWELWDSRAISREFLNRVDPLKGAEILYRCFGPGWPVAFFDLPKSFPLIGAEARFFGLLGKGRSFHQRTKLIGRTDELKRLHAFVKSKRTEVLLLPGRAGIGKSRLLLEFARTFNRKHRDATILFVSDEECHPSDYADALTAAPKPLVLVFDDAHRLGEVRRALFPVLRKEAGEGVKLVLALRPGPTHQIRQELVESGFDSSAIEEREPMEALHPDEAMKLAETVLGKWETPKMRQLFARIARESPLLAVMGAELWKEGRLAERDLRDTPEFRDKVLLAGFGRDIEPISERYGEEPVRTFAGMLALLAPVKFESTFFEAVGTFPGFSLRQDQLRDLAAAFDEAGLLLETEAGYRIVPDLLSDQLAFEACYDKRGQDKSFAALVVRHFDVENFPRVIRHLAEAEWQATARLKSRETILEPVWEWFEERFRSSSFYERRKLLGQWADVAHLQPERTLELAELAMRLREAPQEDEDPWFRYRRIETHNYLLGGIPRLLKPLANSRPDFTGRCFDLLWELGKDLDPPNTSFREKDHPILVMGEIAKAEYWKPPGVPETALEWVKAKALGGAMQGNGNPPRFLLAELLKPFFRMVSEESWSSGDAFHYRTHLASVSATARIRETVFSLCRNLAGSGDLAIALGIADVIEEAIRPIGMPFGATPTPQQRSEWDEERKKALALALHLLERCEEPILHFRLRKILLWEISRGNEGESSNYLMAARRAFERISDAFELRLLRASLSHAHDEFPEKWEAEDWHQRVKRLWSEFLGLLADELVRTHPDPPSFVDALTRFAGHVAEYGYTPNWSPLLSTVSDRHPAMALEVTQHLIRERVPNTGEWIRSLLGKATQGDSETHLRFCREAVETQVPDLVAGAIESLAWLRRLDAGGELPDEGWNLLFSVVEAAEEPVYRALMQFLWINDNAPCERDWELVARLPDPPSSDLQGTLVRSVRDLLLPRTSKPDSAVIRKALSSAVSVKAPGHDSFNYSLVGISEHFPAEVFLFFRDRVQYAAQPDDADFEALPLKIGDFPFEGVADHPEVASQVAIWEERLLEGPPLSFDEMRLFRAVALRPGFFFACLERLLARVRTGEHIENVLDLVKDDFGEAIVLREPDFIRALLVKARDVGGEPMYREAFRRLHLLPGCRSSCNGEAAPEWLGLLEAAERLAHRYADDPDLGPLYRCAVEVEREGIEFNRIEHAERRKRSLAE